MKPRVTLISITENYLELIAGAARQCYETELDSCKKMKSIVSHCIDAGHLSILEHAMVTFEIECSLAVLGQLVRHRHLSPTVKSSRGGEPYEMDFVIPDGIKGSEWEGMYKYIMKYVFSTYESCVKSGCALEDASYLLPKGTKTKLRLTGSLRAWFEYLPKRLCKRAMPEHREIARQILEELIVSAPEIFHGREMLNCDTCREGGCFYSGK